MNQSTTLCILIACFSANVESLASDASKCDPALVVATYNKIDSKHFDWRLASLVTENEWDAVAHGGDAHAVIYGVPVGASYSDYHNSAMEKLNSHQESMTQDEFLNIIWTGLDNNSTNAYRACLESEVFSQDGLHLAVRRATQKDVTVEVHWRPVRSDPRSFPAAWTWEDVGKKKLPVRVTQGQTIVTLPRPSQEQQLVLNYNGAADSVVIEPISIFPQAPEVDPNASLVVDGDPIPIDFAQKDKQGPTPGCSCGDTNITFPGNPFRAAVGEPFRFRYDTAAMCRGQAFDRFHGQINWDSHQITSMANANNNIFPGISGTVRTVFSKAGDYNVTASITVDCIDSFRSCRNTCSAQGVAAVHIGK